MFKKFFLILLLIISVPVYANILIVPNPYRPNDGNSETGKIYNAADPTSGIIFTNLVSNSDIRIFDMRGMLIRRIYVNSNGNFQWDVLADNGNPVRSGSYSVFIRTPISKIRKKLVIIR